MDFSASGLRPFPKPVISFTKLRADFVLTMPANFHRTSFSYRSLILSLTLTYTIILHSYRSAPGRGGGMAEANLAWRG